MKIKKLSQKDEAYPALLGEINSPPKQLYTLGDQELLNSRCVAVVGSRKAIDYGKEATHQIAAKLAECGLTIVSGLALGIDAAAHRAALEAGGDTIAVQANGLDEIYPATNRNLAKEILAKGGTIISEYEEGTPSLKQHFVARNRLISGLSIGIVVTQAAEGSGSLITANFALEQNRVVMAVPGNITSQMSVGANSLIKSGAYPVTSAEDVLDALELEAPELQAETATADSEEEQIILDLLSEGVNQDDDLIKQSGFDASEFNRVISLMELSGKVKNLGAGKWISK